MATVVLGANPPEIEALIESSRRSGIDRLDEVWEGVLHMVRAPDFDHARVGQQLAEVLGPAELTARIDWP